MTAPRLSDPNAPNLVLMLHEWLPSAIQGTKASIAAHEAAILTLRADLEKLVKHAAVEGLSIVDEEPPKPLRVEP